MIRCKLNEQILQNLRFNLSPSFYKEHKGHNSDLFIFYELKASESLRAIFILFLMSFWSLSQICDNVFDQFIL